MSTQPCNGRSRARACMVKLAATCSVPLSSVRARHTIVCEPCLAAQSSPSTLDAVSAKRSAARSASTATAVPTAATASAAVMIARVIAVTVPYPFQRRRYHVGNPTSCNDAQKPRDGSGTVSASARRALPFKRHSGQMPIAKRLSSPDILSRQEARLGRPSARGSHTPRIVDALLAIVCSRERAGGSPGPHRSSIREFESTLVRRDAEAPKSKKPTQPG